MGIEKNYYSGFSRIDKVLAKTAKEHHFENALYRYKALKSWHKIANGFLEGAAELTKAMDLKKGVLTIACLSREAAYRLKLLAQRIIYEINRLLGKQVVFAIYLEV